MSLPMKLSLFALPPLILALILSMGSERIPDEEQRSVKEKTALSVRSEPKRRMGEPILRFPKARGPSRSGEDLLLAYSPQKGDDADNLSYLELLNRNSHRYAPSLGVKAVALVPTSSGLKSQALLLSLANGVGTGMMMTVMRGTATSEELEEYEALTALRRAELERIFPSNPYVWDLILDQFGSASDEKKRFSQIHHIWEYRETNPELQASEDKILITLLVASLRSDEEDRRIAAQAIEMVGGLEVRGREFLEGLDSTLPDECTNVGAPCPSPAIKDLLQRSVSRQQPSGPIQFAIRALLSSAISAYEDESVLKKQSEYRISGYPNDLRVELNQYVSRHYLKPYLLSLSCQDRVLLLATSSGFEFVLQDLSEEQVQGIKNCIESSKGRLDRNVTFKVLRALRDAPRIRKMAGTFIVTTPDREVR